MISSTMASSPPASPGDPKAGTMARSTERSGDLRLNTSAMSTEESAGDLRVTMTATSTEASAGDLRKSMTAMSTEVSAGDLRESMTATSPDARPDDLSAGTMGTSAGATPILQTKRGQCHMVEKSAGSEEGPKTMPSGKLSEIRKSERLRNQPKRKPFSDLTNGLAPAFVSFPSSIPDVTSTKPPSSVISNAAKNKKVQNLRPTSTLRGIPSDSDLVKDQTCSTPHTQQRPTGKDYKGKSLVVASSSDCTQLGRTSSMRLKLESARVDHRQAKSFSVPLGKPKKIDDLCQKTDEAHDFSSSFCLSWPMKVKT